MENDNYDLRLLAIQSKLRTALLSRCKTDIKEIEDADEAYEAEEINSNKREYSSKTQLSNEIQSSSSENNSYKNEADDEFNDRYFYVDKYENEQLKMLIRLFIFKVTNSIKDHESKLDDGVLVLYCSVPNNLWTEKQINSGDSNNCYKSHDNLNNDRITDFIEDSLDAVNENKQSELKENPYDYACNQAIKSIETKGLETNFINKIEIY